MLLHLIRLLFPGNRPPIRAKPWREEVVGLQISLASSTLDLLAQAEREAQQRSQPFIGTEHILIALCRDNSGGRPALVGVSVAELERTVAAIAPTNPRPETSGMIGFTQRSKVALKEAGKVAVGRGSTAVLPSHLWEGLVREKRGIAAKVLKGHLLTS